MGPAGNLDRLENARLDQRLDRLPCVVGAETEIVAQFLRCGESKRARHGRHRIIVGGRRRHRGGRLLGRVVGHWVGDRTHLADERQVVRYLP